MNLRRLQCLLEGEWRQDGWHALRQHGLAGSWRADHQDVVTSGAGDFEGALGGLLSANIFEVHGKLLRLAEQGFTVHAERQDAVTGVDEADHIQQRLHGIDRDASDHGCFFGVKFGDDQLRNFLASRLYRDRQGAANAANASIEGQLADKEAIGYFLLVESAISAKNS